MWFRTSSRLSEWTFVQWHYIWWGLCMSEIVSLVICPFTGLFDSSVWFVYIVYVIKLSSPLNVCLCLCACVYVCVHVYIYIYVCVCACACGVTNIFYIYATFSYYSLQKSAISASDLYWTFNAVYAFPPPYPGIVRVQTLLNCSLIINDIILMLSITIIEILPFDVHYK